MRMMIMAYDPRKYTLKTNAATPAKINRLIKAVKDNAIKDRKKSEELLAKVSNTFEQIHSNFDSEDNEGVKIYTEIAKTVIQAINSNGAANEKLLKIATLMQRFIEKDDLSKKGKAPGFGSLFKEVQLLADEDNDD